jgi:hypothetical protein
MTILEAIDYIDTSWFIDELFALLAQPQSSAESETGE